MVLSLGLVAFLLLGADPGPVIQHTDDGAIDWTHHEATVVGVGTPRMLSPTASVTEGDLEALAERDASARLLRLLRTVALRPGQRSAVTPERARAMEAAALGVGDPPRRFSDGTIHRPLRMGLGALDAEAEAAHGPPAPPLPGGPTGLLIRVRGEPKPALQVALSSGDGATKRQAGFLSDPFGQAGVVWARSEKDTAVVAQVGPRPRVVDAEPGRAPGELRLAGATPIWFAEPTQEPTPGGIAVVILPPAAPASKGKGKGQR